MFLFFLAANETTAMATHSSLASSAAVGPNPTLATRESHSTKRKCLLFVGRVVRRLDSSLFKLVSDLLQFLHVESCSVSFVRCLC